MSARKPTSVKIGDITEFFSGENSRYIDVIGKAFEKEIQMHGYNFEKKT